MTTYISLAQLTPIDQHIYRELRDILDVVELISMAQEHSSRESIDSFVHHMNRRRDYASRELLASTKYLGFKAVKYGSSFSALASHVKMLAAIDEDSGDYSRNSATQQYIDGVVLALPDDKKGTVGFALQAVLGHEYLEKYRSARVQEQSLPQQIIRPSKNPAYFVQFAGQGN